MHTDLHTSENLEEDIQGQNQSKQKSSLLEANNHTALYKQIKVKMSDTGSAAVQVQRTQYTKQLWL